MSGPEATGSGEEREARREVRPRIYVASLADYNNGLLHGQWLEVDGEADELQAGIDRMLADSPTAQRFGESAEEFAIHDIDGFGAWRIGEYESLQTIAWVAAGMRQQGMAFAAWWSETGSEQLEFLSEQTFEAIEEAFLAQYQGVFDSEEAYGDTMLEDFGVDLDRLEIPAMLRPYLQIDVAGWVRDMKLEGAIQVVEIPGDGVWVFWT